MRPHRPGRADRPLPKEAPLDEPGEPLVHRFETAQRAIEGNHLVGDRFHRQRRIVQRRLSPIAAAFLRVALAGVVDQNLPHRASREREEMRLVRVAQGRSAAGV